MKLYLKAKRKEKCLIHFYVLSKQITKSHWIDAIFGPQTHSAAHMSNDLQDLAFAVGMNA